MRRMILWATSLLLLLVCCVGCATVATGKYQQVPVMSEPSGVKVTADKEVTITTPGSLNLIRNKPHTLVAEYQDCEPQQTILNNKVQGWFWGNVALGGGIGMIVDMSSGACDELFPKKVYFNFTEAGQAVAKRKSSYLESHPETDEEVRFAILNGLAKEGMTKEELIASYGLPDSNEVKEKGTLFGKKKYEVLLYHDKKPTTYIFEKGKLKKPKK